MNFLLQLMIYDSIELVLLVQVLKYVRFLLSNMEF